MAEEVLIKSAGSWGIASFIFKHWYIFLFILVSLPLIINSISIAKQTQNPSYPFIVLGLRMVNADQVIYNDVQLMKTNPDSLIGMQKPLAGVWAKTKYYWDYFWNVIFRLFGELFLITLPFVAFYRFAKLKDNSSTGKNVLVALFLGLIFIFIINLILLIHGLIRGTFTGTMPQEGFFLEAWWIIKMVLPFHGIASLVSYIISSF